MNKISVTCNQPIDYTIYLLILSTPSLIIFINEIGSIDLFFFSLFFNVCSLKPKN